MCGEGGGLEEGPPPTPVPAPAHWTLVQGSLLCRSLFMFPGGTGDSLRPRGAGCRAPSVSGTRGLRYLPSWIPPLRSR